MENYEYKSLHLVQDDEDTIATIIKLISTNRWEFYKQLPSTSGVGTEMIFRRDVSERTANGVIDAV